MTELLRLEQKVDGLTDAINKLVLFEERQFVQGQALLSLTERVTDSEKKLDMWINRGIGVWAVVASAASLYKLIPL